MSDDSHGTRKTRDECNAAWERDHRSADGTYDAEMWGNPADREPTAACVRDQQIVVSFRSDDATARELCQVMQAAVAARYTPTEENASALFALAAEAVVVAAHPPPQTLGEVRDRRWLEP